jgi:integrase
LERFSTPEDIARHLQITRRQVLQAARQNLLPAHPISFGGRRRIWRFKISEVDAAIAGILIERDGKTYSKDGDLVKRFGFHNLGRHSLATFLMDEQENPAVVQAIMRHAKMDMTLYYSHSSKRAKRAAVENYARRIAPESVRVQMRVQETIQ